MLVISGRLIIPAALLALAILGYVSVGAADGGGGGVPILVSIALMLVALRRARQDPAQAAVAARIGSRALMLLPGAMLVYLSFALGDSSPDRRPW